MTSTAGFLFAFTTSNSALACAVCFSAKNEASRTAFIVTTAGLTIFPLLFIAWGVSWVIRREREQEAADDAVRSEGAQQFARSEQPDVLDQETSSQNSANSAPS